MKIISKKQALKIIIVLLSVVMIFHLLIIFEIIPYTIVWAGKLKSVQEMRVFECISLLIGSLNIAVLLLKGNYIKNKIPTSIINGILWAFVALFSLNTIGNLFAETMIEKVVFTPLTLVSAILIFIIVRKGKSRNE